MVPRKETNPAKLLHWLDEVPRLRIGVLGDFAADHYLVGSTSRISREAPVLILKKREDTILPGQAGNSASNLAALDVQCLAFGIVGGDKEAEGLLAALSNRGVDVGGMISAPKARTILKTRVLAGGHHAALQQVIRLDDDEGLLIEAEHRRRLSGAVLEALPSLDALLVSDYGYGTVHPKLWDQIGKARGRRPLRVLDSRYSLAQFKGADIITPNETEVFAQLGIRGISRANAEAAGGRLMKKTRCRGLVMTRGNEGMLVFDASSHPFPLPIFGSDEVTDVTGAGDTVAAVITAVKSAGGSLLEAARLANVAAGLAVMKLGAATVTRQEIREAIKREGCP